MRVREGVLLPLPKRRPLSLQMLAEREVAAKGAIVGGGREVDSDKREGMPVVQEGSLKVDGVQLHVLHVRQIVLLHVLAAVVARPQRPLQVPPLQEKTGLGPKPLEGDHGAHEPLHLALSLQPGCCQQLQAD